MKVLLGNQFFKSEIINLKVENFKNEIQNLNQKGEKVTDNQISNMSNIHQSLLIAKNCEDLIYFVEDDYLHSINSIKEMILSYDLYQTLSTLKENKVEVNGRKNPHKIADGYGQVIMPLIEELGDTCTQLEGLIDNEIWPLPKFQELLFTR